MHFASVATWRHACRLDHPTGRASSHPITHPAPQSCLFPNISEPQQQLCSTAVKVCLYLTAEDLPKLACLQVSCKKKASRGMSPVCLAGASGAGCSAPCKLVCLQPGRFAPTSRNFVQQQQRPLILDTIFCQHGCFLDSAPAATCLALLCVYTHQVFEMLCHPISQASSPAQQKQPHIPVCGLQLLFLGDSTQQAVPPCVPPAMQHACQAWILALCALLVLACQQTCQTLNLGWKRTELPGWPPGEQKAAWLLLPVATWTGWMENASKKPCAHTPDCSLQCLLQAELNLICSAASKTQVKCVCIFVLMRVCFVLSHHQFLPLPESTHAGRQCPFACWCPLSRTQCRVHAN